VNEKQSALYDVICSIVQIKNVTELMKYSEIRYGYLNYVAKYSLAKDTYFATELSYSHLKKGGFLQDSRLRRGLKSQKNGFTFEHPIPANVIADQILLYRNDPSMIKDILKRGDCVFVLTKSEDDCLRSNFVSSMPKNWNFFTDNILERYLQTGIVQPDTPTIEVSVYGSVKR
jgi:hypothetical protein